jgi:hypothetical protein
MMNDGSDPMSHDHPIRQPEPALPESALHDDIRDIAALLDRAGAATRAMPDASFEARVAMRTRPVPIRSEEVRPSLSLPHLGTWGGRRTAGPMWASRIAAALAVAGGLMAAWMGTRPASMPSTIAPSSVATGSTGSNDDIELAFAVAGLGDQNASTLDELRLQAESIDSTIRRGIDMTDLFGEEGST